MQDTPLGRVGAGPWSQENHDVFNAHFPDLAARERLGQARARAAFDLARRNSGKMGYGGLGRQPGYYDPGAMDQVHGLVRAHQAQQAANNMTAWDRGRIALGQGYLDQAAQMPELPETSEYAHGGLIRGKNPESTIWVVPNGAGQSSLINNATLSQALGRNVNLGDAAQAAGDKSFMRRLVNDARARATLEFMKTPAYKSMQDRQQAEKDDKLLARAAFHGVGQSHPAVAMAMIRHKARQAALMDQLKNEARNGAPGSQPPPPPSSGQSSGGWGQWIRPMFSMTGLIPDISFPGRK